MPSTSSFPNSFLRPTIAQILVVPMSSPTTIFSCPMVVNFFYSGCFLSSYNFLLRSIYTVTSRYLILFCYDLPFIFQVHALVFVPAHARKNFFIEYLQLSELRFQVIGF